MSAVMAPSPPLAVLAEGQISLTRVSGLCLRADIGAYSGLTQGLIQQQRILDKLSPAYRRVARG